MSGIARSSGRGDATLIPTPDAGSGKRGADPTALSKGRYLADGRRSHQVTPNDVAAALMPTPDAGVFEGRPETRRARRDRIAAAYRSGSGMAGNGFGLTIGMLAQDLLPTPNGYSADRGGSQDPAKRRAGGHQVNLEDVIEQGMLPGDMMMLPTPSAQNSHGNETNNRDELLLPGLAAQLPTPAARDWKSGMRPALLPTPTASDGLAGGVSRSGARSGELLLAGLTTAMLRRVSFGESATVTTRQQSAHGRRSPDGAHQSPLFPTGGGTSG